MINWKSTQTRLRDAGYAPGNIDGDPGKMTLTALFAYEARRQPDATIRSIATAAAAPQTGVAGYGLLDSAPRLAEFIAQTANESAGFSVFEENLRYSAKRLMAVWPNRFPTLASALPYAWDSSDPDREDLALANLVYGARMGNQGNGVNDNDGWDYRGRGMLQLTGYDNYALFGSRLGLDLIGHPDRASDPAVSLRIACEFWKQAKVNTWVDQGDFYAARGMINVGQAHPKERPIGLDEVAARRKHVLQILAA
jgi:putative chitinase